jgi:hypothetical protein
MDTKNLTDLDPATLVALAKKAAEAAKETRESLAPGVHAVDRILTLVLDAEVKVSEDHEAVTPQKAKPWHIIAVLLQELETARKAAKMGGIDLAKVIENAEKVDKEIADKAMAEANEQVAALKAPTVSTRKGAVRVKGAAKIPA